MPKQSISITLKRDGQGWLVRCEWLNIFSSGATSEAALEDFMAQFKYQKEHSRSASFVPLSLGETIAKRFADLEVPNE